MPRRVYMPGNPYILSDTDGVLILSIAIYNRNKEKGKLNNRIILFVCFTGVTVSFKVGPEPNVALCSDDGSDI